MKKKRFNETQIIQILQEHEAGLSMRSCHASMVSVKVRYTLGAASMPA